MNDFLTIERQKMTACGESYVGGMRIDELGIELFCVAITLCIDSFGSPEKD